MLKDIDKTSLFCEYYKLWVDVYKKDAIRDATMAKYLMTQKWVEKLVPDLKVSELTRTSYQQLLNEYAKEHITEQAKMQKSLEVIARQTQRCSRIVEQLLQLRKLEQNQITLDLEYANIDEIVEAVCDDEKMKTEKEVDFRLKLGGVWAKVDVILMMSLIQNLINNAVKYSSTPAVVEIATEKGQNEVRVIVKDYGCGMEKEEWKNIFVSFYRIEKARNSEGFGLGLSLVERIAQVHGGKIIVESEIGKGSCFILTLPI